MLLVIVLMALPVFGSLALIWFLLARAPTRDPEEDRSRPPADGEAKR